MSTHRTDWHRAAICALQIDLIQYSHILEYHAEYFLTPNKNRIDLLIIKKLVQIPIPQSIASIFQSFNLFEIKGFQSTLSTDTYYKTNGHAGYFINSTGTANEYSRKDISLSFLSFHYPRNLMKHLEKECNKTIANPFPGIYHIINDMYPTQIIVTQELSAEDSLYLRCLTKNFQDISLINRLVDDYKNNQNNKLYTDYMDQLSNANRTTKGASPMVCEGILNLCGTSTKEIEERTANLYIPKLNQLTEENNALSSEVSKLKNLLTQHGIAY